MPAEGFPRAFLRSLGRRNGSYAPKLAEMDKSGADRREKSIGFHNCSAHFSVLQWHCR